MMYRIYRKLILFGLITGNFIHGPPVEADTENDIQQWTTIRLNHPVNERWAVSLWTQVRIDNNVTEFNSVMIRPAVHIAVASHWHLGVGYNYWGKDSGADENWLWQEASFSQAFNKLSLGHRLRIEERFIDGISGIIARTRYRLHAAHPIKNSPWYLTGSEEMFVNLNNKGEGPVSGFEQNRLFAGLGVHVGGHVRLEAGYMWRYEKERSGTNRSDHVISVNIFLDSLFKSPPLLPDHRESHY